MRDIWTRDWSPETKLVALAMSYFDTPDDLAKATGLPPSVVSASVAKIGDSFQNWSDVIRRWNDLAHRFTLTPIRGKLNSSRQKTYRARLLENPDWWDILETSLPRRSTFYRDTAQPSFDQAIRSSYFDAKIRDGAWNATASEQDSDYRPPRESAPTPTSILSKVYKDDPDPPQHDPPITLREWRARQQNP